VSYEAALAALIDLAQSAHLVRMTDRGELWRSAAPERLRFLVARGNAGLPQLVTVLPEHDRCR
jgi:hypothetical protein